MRIEVTEDCAGTGQCVAVAPDVFALNDEGLSTVRTLPTSAADVEAAKEAAALCPMAAIRIDD